MFFSLLISMILGRLNKDCFLRALFPSLLDVKCLSNLLGVARIFSGSEKCTTLTHRNCFFFERFSGYKCKKSFLFRKLYDVS